MFKICPYLVPDPWIVIKDASSSASLNCPSIVTIQNLNRISETFFTSKLQILFWKSFNLVLFCFEGLIQQNYHNSLMLKNGVQIQ